MKYFKINNKQIEVTDEIYYSCKKIQNREEYLRRLDIKYKLIYPSTYDKENFNALEAIKDNRKTAEQILETRELEQKIADCILTLEKYEKYLIEQLFFENRTLSSVARELGVSATNIKRRRDRILKKLRVILEKKYKIFLEDAIY